MGLEARFDYLSDFNVDWPEPGDPVAQGDDHIRGIKNATLSAISNNASSTSIFIDSDLAVGLLDSSATFQAAPGSGEEYTLTIAGETQALASLIGVPGGVTLQLDEDDATLNLAGFVGGLPVSLGSFDPAGAAVLTFAGNPAIETDVNGGRAKSVSGAGIFYIEAADGTNGRIQKTAGSALQLRNSDPGQAVGLQARNVADSANVDVFSGVADGASWIGYAGIPVATTTSSGLQVNREAGSVTYLRVADPAGAQAQVLKVDASYAAFRNTGPGELVRLEGRNAADNATIALFQGDPDGSVYLYYNNATRLQTGSIGVNIDAGDTSRLSFYNGGGDLAAYIQTVSAGAFTLDQRTPSAPLDLLLGGTVVARADAGAKTWRTYSNGEQMTQTATVSQRDTTNSGLYVTDAGGALRPVGFNILIQGDVNVPTYTVSATDSGKRLRLRAGNVNVNFGSISMSIGGTLVVINSDAAEPVNLNSTGSMSWYSGGGRIDGVNRRLARGGVCTIVKVASTDFEIWGSGIS